MNRYSIWKYLLIFIIIVVGTVYALPNLYGKDPALQVSATGSAEVSDLTRFEVEDALESAGMVPSGMEMDANSLIIRFADEETQLKAQSIVSSALGNRYGVGINLVPATPDWLRNLNAKPMSLGLDLRGGVHFLMEVDMQAAQAKAEDRYVSDIRNLLRENKIRYRTIGRRADSGLLIRFRDAEQRTQGIEEIESEFSDLEVVELNNPQGEFNALATLKEAAILETKRFALQQNITTIRKRVNELGVAEPIVQQQGLNRIVVQLPGIQCAPCARDVIGATATLEFRMVDEEHDVQDALDGRLPAGSKLYKERNGQAVLLEKQTILTGDYITNAASGIDQQTGGPNVSITLDGKGAKRFSDATGDRVGKRMAVVFIENKTTTIVKDDGEITKRKEIIEEVISIAVIRSQLGKNFQITGLDSKREARNLALLLRAGALAAPVEIIEERTIGPSLGKDNIDKGMQSVVIGFALVLIFMLVYYRVFGLAANFALTLNLVLIIALLSMLQATLTLPGIAGIVLTVGMAVDANVLIFQRIREEIKNGNSPQASIHAGYEKAFSTIADANVTTFIAAIVLFGFGTGPIKGFAVTLSLGIICSMFTAIMVTRAIINFLYGGKKLEKLSI